MERYFRKNDTPKREKADFASDYLQSYAKYFFQKLIKAKGDLSWSKLVKALRKNYDSPNQQRQYKKQLSNLKQSGSIMDYIREFDKLTSQIHNMDSECQMMRFMDGLRDDLRYRVEGTDPKNTQEAKEKARLLGTSHYKPSEPSFYRPNEQNHYISNNHHSFSNQSNNYYRPNEHNHYISNNHHNSSNQSNNHYRPNEHNHYKSNNYYSSNNQPNNSYEPNEANSYKPTNPKITYIDHRRNNDRRFRDTEDSENDKVKPGKNKKNSEYCFQGCGEIWYRGHRCADTITAKMIAQNQQNLKVTANMIKSLVEEKSKSDTITANQIKSLIEEVKSLKTCTKPNAVSLMAKKEIETHKLLKINGLLCGHEIVCIIDTGSSNSILSSETANRLNVKLSDNITTVALADGTTTQACSTIDLDFSITGKNSKQTFLITEFNESDALIGLDWLSKYDICIHPTKRTLKFLSPFITKEKDLEKNSKNNEIGKPNKLKSFVNLVNINIDTSTILPKINSTLIIDNLKFCEIRDNKAILDLPDRCRYDYIHTPHFNNNLYQRLYNKKFFHFYLKIKKKKKKIHFLEIFVLLLSCIFFYIIHGVGKKKVSDIEPIYLFFLYDTPNTK